MSLNLYRRFDWNGETFDTIIEYEITSHTKGYAGDYYNPPEPAEYEFNIINISFDPADEDMPDDMKDHIEEWFNSREGYAYACEIADEESCYDDREYEYIDREDC